MSKNNGTFLIEAPLFVHEQIKQHRSLMNLVMANNAISRRYTDVGIWFWQPTEWRGQSKTNKQASSDEVISEVLLADGQAVDPFQMYEDQCRQSLYCYNSMIKSGIAKEQARAILPTSLLTRFYLGGTLRDWV